MAGLKDIPDGWHNVKLGESFFAHSSDPDTTHHTVRYDFKPASIAEGSESYISLNDNNAVTVVVPKKNEQSQSDEVTDVSVFEGAKKQNLKEKECLLLYDHETGEFRLEPLNSQIQVKKARKDKKTKEKNCQNHK